DLVDEEDVARLQIGEECREVAGALDDRARGGAKPDTHLARDDLRQRRLAEAGGPVKEHVVERLAAGAGGGDEDVEVLAHLALPDEIVESERAKRGLARVVLAPRRVDEARIGGGHVRRAHAESSLRPLRMSPSMPASGPSLAAARATAVIASA